MLKHKIYLLLFICYYSGLLLAQSTTKPKVLIITTGGTIASVTDSASIEGPELIRAVPQLTEFANIEVEEFSNIGSSKMTPKLWLQLVQRIGVLLEESSDITCIAITHGTDTMEETAFFLNLTHTKSIPIVLVGSMRASDEISADWPANLLNAVRVGISEEAKGKGVMVVMNDNISAGRDLQKAHNRRVNAFQATDRGYLGFIDPEKVTFYQSPGKPHTVHSEFNVYELDSLPTVDIVQDFAGFDPDILAYFINRPNQGLVVSSFAGGRVSSGVAQSIKLPAEHKPIVVSSSIKGGRIMGANPPGTPIIVANDLPANKARILLMLALTKTTNIGQIQDYFHRYLDEISSVISQKLTADFRKRG